MIGPLFRRDIQELIRDKRWAVLRDALSEFDPSDIAEILIEVPDEDDVAIFRLLPRDLAGRVFSYLPLDHQENLIRCLSNDQMRQILDGMTPDDQAPLTELRLRDWWRVFARELRSGLTLGAWLGFIGFVRITVWQVVAWVPAQMAGLTYFAPNRPLNPL